MLLLTYNYESPFTPYLTDMYVTLNPPVFIKRNAFFLNQYFSDDDYWLFVFGDDVAPSVKPLFSRYEEYSIWKGLNRREIDFLPDDYAGYAIVYIRSDLKKTLIKRKYQNFLEFWADATSLLMAIYEVVSFILSYIDYFYSYHSLSQNIFFFKNLENENFFNIIRFITQSLKNQINRENVRQWLFQYISFCSWGITYAIRIKMPPSDDMNKSLKLLLTQTYSEDNLNDFLDKLNKSLLMKQLKVIN